MTPDLQRGFDTYDYDVMMSAVFRIVLVKRQNKNRVTWHQSRVNPLNYSNFWL